MFIEQTRKKKHPNKINVGDYVSIQVDKTNNAYCLRLI